MNEAFDTSQAHEYAQSGGKPGWSLVIHELFVQPTWQAADKEHSAVTKGDHD